MNEQERNEVARQMLLEAFDPETGEFDYGYLGDGFMSALREGVSLELIPSFLIGYIGKGSEYIARTEQKG
jgi:hypothetical protein